MTKLCFAMVTLVACGGANKPVSNSGGTNGPVEVTWVAEQAENELVDVSIRIGTTKVSLGKISAASDDAPGTPKTCSLMTEKATPAASAFN